MRQSKSLIELERERGRLLERIAGQRQQLSTQFVPVAQLLQFGDRVAQTVQAGRDFVQRHPWAMGSLAALMLLRRPRFIGRWAKRGLLVWRTWRTGRNLLQAVQRQLARMG